MDKHEKNHLEESAHVETEGELSGRLVGRRREARDEGAVETTDARLCFVRVNRGLLNTQKQERESETERERGTERFIDIENKENKEKLLHVLSYMGLSLVFHVF